jgi:hypothetical protein
MTRDLAAFDRQLLRAIYGEFPHCFFLPNRRAEQFHHIYGRGATRRDKHIFSSVFNACPITAEIHANCPLLNTQGFRRSLVDHAIKHVHMAQAQGRYLLTDADIAFLEWFALHG